MPDVIDDGSLQAVHHIHPLKTPGPDGTHAILTKNAGTLLVKTFVVRFKDFIKYGYFLKEMYRTKYCFNP